MTPCQELQEAMMRVLDGIGSTEDRTALDEHIENCPECAAEYKDFVATKAATDSIRDSLAFDDVLDSIEQGVWNRMQRGLATTLLVAGLAIVTLFGVGTAILDPQAPVAIRAGIALAATGMLLYIGQVIRWRMRTGRSDPYGDIVR